MAKQNVIKETVSAIQNNGVATVIFEHPKANCLTRAMLERLTGIINGFAADPIVRVIILKSNGEANFCAGASFEEFAQLKNLEEAIEFFSGFARLIVAMQRCPKFIIARVQGKAVGGGVGLIAAADYVLAKNDASIKLSELEIGLGPFVIAPALIRKLGQARFDAMAIDCLWRDALWAKDAGLYADILSSTGELDDAVDSLSTRLSSFSESASHTLKKTIGEATEDWGNYLSRRAQISARLLAVKQGWTAAY
jgi:methylglutaconyl-CoA hydratase